MYLVKVDYRYLEAEGTTFDKSDESLTENKVLYKFEHHIIYSSSYQVPVLYFNICDQGKNWKTL